MRVAHAPGIPGTFSRPPRVSDPDMHHGTCMAHVPWCMMGSLTSGFLWSWWRGKHSQHFRRKRLYIGLPVYKFGLCEMFYSVSRRFRWSSCHMIGRDKKIASHPSSNASFCEFLSRQIRRARRIWRARQNLLSSSTWSYIICSHISKWHTSTYLLTHWDLNKMTPILHTTFSNASSSLKMFDFRLTFHWSFFPIFQHLFR